MENIAIVYLLPSSVWLSMPCARPRKHITHHSKIETLKKFRKSKFSIELYIFLLEMAFINTQAYSHPRKHVTNDSKIETLRKFSQQ